MSAHHTLSLAAGALLALAASPALAGDPCPIGFTLIDVGPPPWTPAAMVADSNSKARAFLSRLAGWAAKQSCTRIVVKSVVSAKLDLAGNGVAAKRLSIDTVRQALFDKARRFRCTRAARSLRPIKDAADTSGLLLHLRGKKRTLLAVAGWRSLCLMNRTLDRASKGDLKRIWARLTRQLIAHRHANP